MTKTPVIAIDGPAASGKGTLSRVLAAHLGYAHMDTGALYRAVAYEVVQAGNDPANEVEVVAGAEVLSRKLSSDGVILANPALRTDEIGTAASKVAAHPAVRDALVQLQRDFSAKPGAGFKGAVLDGRDIGTVICPDADVKLFVTADIEIRAERRRKELHSRGVEVTYEAVLKDMRARDVRDSERKTAPMRPADDATLLDTGDLNAEEVLQKALEIVQEKLGG